MKLGVQHLKILPLLASALVVAVVLVVAFLKPNLFVDEGKLSKEPKSSGSLTLADLKKQIPQSKEGYFQLQAVELYFSNEDDAVREVLSGQMVETTAQILIGKTKDSEGQLLRVYQVGPGADRHTSRQYSVLLEFETAPPQFKEHEWVRVVGKVAYKAVNGKTEACLIVNEIAPTKPPQQSIY